MINTGAASFSSLTPTIILEVLRAMEGLLEESMAFQ